MKKTKLLALALALLWVLMAVTGCAASSAPQTSASMDSAKTEAMIETPMAEPEAPAEEFIEEAVTDSFMTTESPASGVTADSPAADDPQSAADYAAKIIYRADVYLQTTEFDQTAASIEAMTASFGGFVENSNVSGDVDYRSDGTTQVVNRYGYYTLRVPCDRFEEFLSQTQGLGNVIQQSKTAENVTSQYTDYEARLTSLRTQEERLLSMLEKSEDVETLIAIEQRLADVRYETEYIERSLRNLDTQINYSTVDITLQEVEVYTPTAPVTRTFGEKLSDAFSDGWQSFTWGLQYFVLDVVEALPVLVILAVIVVAAVILIRRAMKKRRAKKAPPEAPKDTPKE